MMVGNRLIANFKTRLGLDLTKPEQDQADVEKEAMKMLAELRAEYNRLADCFRSKKAREVAFSENRLLTSETAYYLADEYFGLLANEEKNFRNLGKVLEEVPIYVHFLKGVKGCGPAMSGVIISELDPHKARTPSSFWKYCFPEGVMVAAPSRQIPIENMVPGDVVLNAHGDEVLVKKTMRREYSGALYTIKAAGMLPVPATDEHPFLIERDDQQVWVKAEDLKVGDFLVFPKHVAPSESPESESESPESPSPPPKSPKSPKSSPPPSPSSEEESSLDESLELELPPPSLIPEPSTAPDAIALSVIT
jgi:hypothetical protein